MNRDADKPEEDASDESQRDSRLETFLRRASAIIAAEKGLNNVAKAKLDDLATRLHLPDDLFDKGLTKLQDSNSPVGELTDYEKGFLKFLEREFSQKREGTVLSISIEEKAITHARNRFGIAAHRAEQLIDHQAQESGIGRLSRSDAREFGRQMILDLVGDKRSLDDVTEKKVFRIGRRWGCDSEEVQRLIDIKFDENEAKLRKLQRRPFVLGVITMIGLLVAGVGGKMINDNFKSFFEDPIAKKAPLDPPREIPEPNLEEAKSELELTFPDLASALVNTDAKTRSDAIAIATERTLNSPNGFNKQAMTLRGWFLNEPEPVVAQRFVRVLDDVLSEEPRTNRDSALHRPYRAVSLALDICNSTSSPQSLPRRQMLLQHVKNSCGLNSTDSVPADSTHLESAPFETSIASRQWNQLIENAWQSPARNSILVESLSDLTRTRLTEKQRQEFVSRSVRTILLADRKQWRNMREPLLSTIQSADEVQRIEWIDIWLNDFDGTTGFREFVGPHLVALSGKEPKPSSRDYEAFLRSERSQWKTRRLQSALKRHQEIGRRATELVALMNPTADARVAPDFIFKVASLSNLCLEAMAITKSGRAGDESAWSEVDAELEQQDLRLRDFVFLEEPASERPPLTSAGFDTTLRDRTMAAFTNRSNDNQAKRLAAIERLPGLAEKFESLPQPMAESLAQYLLSPIEPNEWLQMQRVVPDLLKWPRLVLALADQIPEALAPRDQLMTMFTVLNGEPLVVQQNEDMNVRMSLELRKLARESLLADEAVDPNSSDSDWIRLEKYLRTAFYRRGSLLGERPSGSNRSALENLKTCLRATSDNTALVDRAIKLVEESTNNELERVVLLNQMVAGIENRFPQTNLGSRLLQTELQLLRNWNQQRERQLKELIDGS
jgi:hypothetical protein